MTFSKSKSRSIIGTSSREMDVQNAKTLSIFKGERAMRDKCVLCGQIVKENRSAHLRDVHGIDSSYKGAVKEYFEDSRVEKEERE
jgi:hypothetical protein